MKRFLRVIWTLYTLLLAVLFLPASLSAFIPPSTLSYITLFGLLFPYLLVLLILTAVLNLFIQKKLAVLLFILLPFGFRNLVNSYAFNRAHFTAVPPKGSLRIMTWNVEGYVSLLPQHNPMAEGRVKLLKLIHRINPDILCLQECNNVENEPPLVSVSHELDSMGYPFHFFSNDQVRGKRPGWYQVQGVAIFSKLPLLDSTRTLIFHQASHDENLASVTILFRQKPLRIFTGHLRSFALFPDTARSADEGANIYEQAYDRKRSILYKLRETEDTHEAETRIIRREIEKSTVPVIYCGDMNSTPASYNFRFLKGDLQDAFLEQGSGLGATFYKIAPTLRIDVCFADDRLQVIQTKVVREKISDHYPLITDVRWR